MSFSPADLTILVGDEVVWSWIPPNGIAPHSTTEDSDPPKWDSGLHFSPHRFRRVFAVAGDYPYHCTLHGAPGGVGMSGVIHVLGADGFDDDDFDNPVPLPASRGVPVSR